MKAMLYVDAENVSIEDLKKHVNSIRDSLKGEEQFIGRFYGAYSNLGGVIDTCYGLGLEYVETSSLLSGTKNVTDMKIIVDCLYDVFNLYKGDVSRVFILSNDCDFTPLVLKLRCSCIEVDAPLFCVDKTKNNSVGVNAFLIEAKYCPLSEKNPLECFKNQFSAIREIVPKEYSDEAIAECLDRKKIRFLKALCDVCGMDIMKLRTIDADKFSFFDAYRFKSLDKSALKIMIRQYTSKFYGAYYPDSVVDRIVHELSQYEAVAV